MVDASVIATKSANVIADSPTGRADRTVVVGSHLASVTEGPGINESATGTKGPNGSGNVEQVFLDYFAQQNLPTEPTEFDGRSDYGSFIDRGIPAGGLFTGAEGIKTADEAAIYGGTAGVAYHPCYHQACDDLGNLSTTALDQMSDATADAVLQFAMTTSFVNGTGQASGKATASTEYGFVPAQVALLTQGVTGQSPVTPSAIFPTRC